MRIHPQMTRDEVTRYITRIDKERALYYKYFTGRGADTILVLTEDGIAEQGNHAELMEKRGIYHSLYSMYEESNT